MATINPASATSATISQLLVKLSDSDPDYRFMALNDLLSVLVSGRPEILQNDYNTAARTADHLVRALDDQNGEVQNLAIKCLGGLVHRLPSPNIGPLIEKLSTMKLKNSVDTAVQSLALITVIAALPSPTPGDPPSKDTVEAYSSISRMLIPRLIGRPVSSVKPTNAKNLRHASRIEDMLEANSSIDMTAEAVDVLIEVVRSFGILLQPVEVEALLDVVVAVLHDSRASSVTKKRAVVAVVILAVYLPDEALSSFITQTADVLNSETVSPAIQRLYISILGSMARSMAVRFRSYISIVVPYTLQALDQEQLDAQLEKIGEGDDSGDFNDVRESALVALEAFLASCPKQMRAFTTETMGACLRYLKYDPNYVGDSDDSDDDMDEGDSDNGSDDEFGDDDEFEADAGFDDDDDASWKVRRCAAKALHTLISTRSSGDLLENGLLYRVAAPALIRRIQEREENVRLEVIAALSVLVRKTGEGMIPEFSLDSSDGQDEMAQLPQSRKRRRQSSSVGGGALGGSSGGGGEVSSPTLERATIPATGPRADLAEKTPSIVAACTKLLKGKQIPTKQAVINLLNDIVTVQRGGLAEYLEQILEPVIEAVKPATAAGTSGSLSVSGGGGGGGGGAGGNASATPATLRVASLRLMGHIVSMHASATLQPYLSRIVDGLLAVVHDRFYKISAEAVGASEEVVRAITPPRARASVASKFKAELHKLYDVLMDRTTGSDVDAEVRQKAIHALGTLLSRTGSAEGAGLVSSEKRAAALEALLERLRNETSRLAAVRAIDTVAASGSGSNSGSGSQFEAGWVRQVTVELAAQLRKANRSLRGSSIQALRHLVQSPDAQGQLDVATVEALVAALQPVITDSDPHLLSPALRILAVLAQEQAQLVVTKEMIGSLCRLLQSSVAATVLEPLLQLVTVIGRSGQGQPLMTGLLQDVGIAGDPAVVGKVVGNLLVASGSSAGVTIDSFIRETQTSRADPLRASLALAVLGEASLRLGRLGAASPIEPRLFLEQFASESDQVSVSAAVALGRAAAGNVGVYVPVILREMAGSSNTQYLALQSVKETLQQVAVDRTDINAYTAAIWAQLLQAAGTENNKAVCAECLGRLAIIAPATFVPRLHELLQDQGQQALRAIAVQALRYTLPESGEAFDAVLGEHLGAMLKTALSDGDMEIRRLAMTALNSAAHNKPELILGQLGELLPYIMDESRAKPELVREVQMGPFKHLVDDGLEVRKGAYETLYALIETAFSRISLISLFERVIDGLADDHDIRSMCNLMLSRLAYVAPAETARQLPSIADKYRVILSTKLKDNAVKQEHEKQEDANKSVLRATLLLADRLRALTGEGSSGSTNPGGTSVSGTSGLGPNNKWSQYWDWVNKTFDAQLRVLRDENRELGTSLTAF